MGIAGTRNQPILILVFLLGPLTAFDPSGAATSSCLLALKASCAAINSNLGAKAGKCFVQQITKTKICEKEVNLTIPFVFLLSSPAEFIWERR